MKEIIQLVSQKAGIGEDKANTAVTTVIGFLKERLPDPIASQIDSVVGGGQAGGEFAEAAKGVGGLFGQKK